MNRSLWTYLGRRHRCGFTLVELLVVIAIIGILVGLLLPAVQAAREAARRANCINNMMQLGLGVHHYEFNAEHLPSGVIDSKGPIHSEGNGQHVSWMVQILPFIEERAAYSRFDIEAGAYAAVNAPVRQHLVQVFICPSAPIERMTEEAPSPSCYAACYHNVEAPIDADNNGLMFLNSKIRYSDILDGSSHTILIGEKLPSNSSLGWVSGTRETLRNTDAIISPRFGVSHQSNEEEAPNSLHVGSFSSYHPGGANFCYADGAIRFISQSIDIQTYHQLGARADGEMMDGDNF